MERNLAWIVDSLNDIKNIIFAEGASCDYETLIVDVNENIQKIQELLADATDEIEIISLQELEKKAILYLNYLNKFQNKQREQEESQPGNE